KPTTRTSRQCASRRSLGTTPRAVSGSLAASACGPTPHRASAAPPASAAARRELILFLERRLYRELKPLLVALGVRAEAFDSPGELLPRLLRALPGHARRHERALEQARLLFDELPALHVHPGELSPSRRFTQLRPGFCEIHARSLARFVVLAAERGDERETHHGEVANHGKPLLGFANIQRSRLE